VPNRSLYGAETGPGYWALSFNQGDNRGYVHWIAGAGKPNPIHRLLIDPSQWEIPGRVAPLEAVTKHGRSIRLLRYPQHPSGGQLGGHIAAFAECRGLTYFASAHGYQHRDVDVRMLDAFLARASCPNS
jgi:hypothetical protein